MGWLSSASNRSSPLPPYLDGQEIIAHVCEAVPIILGAIVVHKLVSQQDLEAFISAAVPEGMRVRI